MKFYGVYVSKNNESLRNQIIESGIFPLSELIKGKEEETYLRMLDGIEGKQVFLYSGFRDIKMHESPFAEFFSPDEYNLDSNISVNKAYARGVVQSINLEDNSIVIDWEKNYQPVTWYRFALQEPISVFDTENPKHEQIYNIVFENQEMNYQWWAENGNWSDKRLKNQKDSSSLEQEFKAWLSRQVKEPVTVDRYTKCLNGHTSLYGEFRLEHDFPFNIFEMDDAHEVDTFYKRLIRLGDLTEWNRAHEASLLSAALGKYRDFLMHMDPSESNHIGNTGLKTMNSLNTILYGPPGTGKTYNTVSEALTILGSSEVAEWQDKKVKSIEELKQAYPGQVEFVTFHQSFSYEDFVEGIRAIPPIEDGNDSEQMIYKTVSGVFQEICQKASSKVKRLVNSNINLTGKNIWKMSLGNTLLNEDFIYDECVENNYILLGYGEDIDFTDCDSREEVKSKLTSDYKSDIANNDYALTSVNVFKNVIKVGDLIVVSDGNSKFRAIAEVTGEYKFLHDDSRSGFKQQRQVRWLQTYEPSLPASRIFDKSLSQMTLYQLKSGTLNHDKLESLLNKADVEDPENKPHILIIDEINRGNISRIFGELITLIEPSKRAGQIEAISVMLPYSKESFSVPNNLYIIGTMNTADRSLAVMDTALRRRFDFIEMMPKADLLSEYGVDGEVDGVDLIQLLTTMNKRIEALYDREHTIGHAFFMTLTEDSSIQDLADIFKNKILPLLEEYFYDDWEKIRLVLADQAKTDTSGLQFYQDVKNLDHDTLFPKISDSAKPIISKSYQRNVTFNPEAYIRIYDTNSPTSLTED